jgi:peptide/nickel transport system permease protein
VASVADMTWPGKIGISSVLLLTAFCVIGSIVTDRPEADLGQISLGPSLQHPLGTDFSGRDNLLLVIHGGPDMLLLAAVAGILTTAIAIAVGAVGGGVGGWTDRILLWCTDLWLTLPRFILLIVIASFADITSTTALAVLLALFSWPPLARQLRSEILSLRSREYVEAAGLLQLGWTNLIIRQMLPSIAPFLVVATIQSMTQAIYQQVGLAFLGLVPLTDNWGVLFSTSYAQNVLYSPTAAWALLSPVLAIVILQMSLVFASRGLEEFFSPQLRGRR